MRKNKILAMTIVLTMVFTMSSAFLQVTNAAKSSTAKTSTVKSASAKISISLDNSTATIIKGGTLTLKATVLPETTTDKTVTFCSSNTSIATVDSFGVVTAIAKGKATITATSNIDARKIAKCKVVVFVPVSKIYLNTTKIETTLGAKSVKLTAKILPADASLKIKNLTFASSDESVATVDRGEVRFIGLGTAVITASADNNVSGTCSVAVSAISITDSLANAKSSQIVSIPTPSGLGGKLKIKLNKATLSLKKGDSETLSAEITPSTITNRDIVWVSGDTSIASVSQDGVVTGLAKGSTSIYAYSAFDSAKSAKCNIKILAPATEIQLNTNTITAVVGGDFVQLKAVLYPSEARSSFEWFSNNSSVSFVDKDKPGKVYITGRGNAIITVTASNGVKAECNVVVGDPITQSAGIPDEVITTPTMTPIPERENYPHESLVVAPTNTPIPTNTPVPTLTPTPIPTNQNMLVGDYVKFGSYDANKDGIIQADEQILWRIINIDSNGSPLLFSDKILCIKAFDAKDSNETDTNRRLYGSNFWGTSNLRAWLNSSDASVAWIGAIPTNANLFTGNCTSTVGDNTGYNTEKGFLYNFTTSEKSAILTNSHKVLLSSTDSLLKSSSSSNIDHIYNDTSTFLQNYDASRYANFADTVRLLSIKELKEFIKNRNWTHKKKPTAKAVANAGYESAFLSTSQNYNYLLDTPVSENSYYVRVADSDNYISCGEAYNTYGVAPVLNLKPNTQISGGLGTITNPYIVQ